MASVTASQKSMHPSIASTGIGLDNQTTGNLCLRTNLSSIIKHVVAPESRSATGPNWNRLEMDAYQKGEVFCQCNWTMGATQMRIVQPHGSYCSWTPLFSRCWGLVVLFVDICRWLFLIGQKRMRWVDAPQYKHSLLVRRYLRSPSVSGRARAQSISIGTGSLYDDDGGDLDEGFHLEVSHSSWRSSNNWLSQLTACVMACHNDVGSRKLSSKFLISLRRPRRKWSQRAWPSHWTSHANCLNSEA